MLSHSRRRRRRRSDRDILGPTSTVMQWVRSNSTDFGGTLPQPRRSVFVNPPFAIFFVVFEFGGVAVWSQIWFELRREIGGERWESFVVVFGGLVDKRFISDMAVYDVSTFLNFSLGNSFFFLKKSYRPLEISFYLFCFCFVFVFFFAHSRWLNFYSMTKNPRKEFLA